MFRQRLDEEKRVLEPIEIARRAAEVAADKQASEIVLLDVRDVCSFADYLVVCSGDSDRQLEAIWEDVRGALKRDGVSIHHTEGTADSGWIVIDAGEVVVHIFATVRRDYYQLDTLWEKAVPLVRLQ